ncbi:fumarylacetoacetate hydrolase family protein [Nitratireductor aquimarinus]|uniref:Fumarylacetoacetate hydrolase family protein n=1 Tax=Nitratireductor aquimarinus TaxID=889300 RepID=A0ABU4ANQ6_9HYPH|nr:MULTISPECIES: fumarylacetoacetate hydrolase family protein [Alphaproteobacteria]MBY6020456.1 fumarylacetoacetate hydrolase family protein [Nitratireductor sp. DP7N14-4]MBN7755670.1 fumarylacetoacetate hydrolase family protein [Nitratireductor aquimarinus]MBN7763250.1 fumarylacetoacetate hydrolase family protein [Nitratireductor aquibiodomus]MBN7776036.1 fumarylacetoacetate hydrolase family protein [Nitratireductor pacificus]MBN7780700.1 fumarylacetoacetate hydrolase family protein [Nitratir
MKLATLKNGTRDGKLVVVSRDLTRCTDASFLAPTLQAALDDWSRIAPHLAALSESLDHGSVPAERFHEHDALSPLPRAYQWADGSAYVNHVELVRKARGAEMPASFWTDPLMYQGGSDTFLAPRDPIVMADEAYGIDMEGEIAVVVDDVPMGATPEEAAAAIRLVMLVNDVSLRGLIPAELGKGFGFFQSKPSSAFSPVAVTPEELGDAWNGGKLSLPLCVDYNGKPFGRADAGVDMTFDFPTLVAHAAKTRPLGAGAIIGSGTVSNKLDGGPGKPVDAGGVGYSCIAEIRMIETINDGKPSTPFMRFGDTVRIEMKDGDGHSIFGAIEQTVQKYEKGA